MCDTLGFSGRISYFGKNSDRSPNEPQILEFYPAADHDEGSLKLTYISVPQVRKTHAVLLSRPTWMWGAEIGVNDRGVCIGNEAVFTLGKYGADSLTGMDMLRLALERCATAAEARDTLISLLEQYGQGGNCGYDHDFRYDNSFLIMDRNDIFVLETAEKKWAWKRYERTSISNRLSIHADADAYSGKICDFALAHTENFFTLGSCSAQRKKQTGGVAEKADGLNDLMLALRTHAHGVKNPFASGTVGSACMHFGKVVGDHTTASMIAALEPDRTVIWSTGSSLPCVSLYKPWLFGTEPVAPVFAAGDEAAEKYWREHERFLRSLIGRVIPQDYFDRRNALEQSWMKLAASADGAADFAELSRKCAEDEREFYKYWSSMELQRAKAGGAFLGRWEKKTAVFSAESEKVFGSV